MRNAIRLWMTDLEGYPGWKEWQRRKFNRTLHFGDPFALTEDDDPEEFKFDEVTEREHEVVLGYLELEDTVNSFKECEFYFRRYPFWRLPVTKHAHLTNISEMYFSRFYEFRERVKRYLNKLKLFNDIDIKSVLKQLGHLFKEELRARHGIHHQRRFQDLAIDQVHLTGVLSESLDRDLGWDREHLVAYRRVSREWANRVRRKGVMMDLILDALAGASLNSCSFLRRFGPTDTT